MNSGEENYNDMPELAQKETPLSSVLNIQEKLLAELREGLHRLDEKLKPICRPAPAEKSNDKTDPEKAVTSAVVHKIEHFNNQIRRAICQVKSIYENLEI
jgi:hypothetical protein